MELDTDLFRRIGGSALTDSRIDVPEAAVEGLDGAAREQGRMCR
jgi:7-cyano-7-deazaguanine synthase in queuosine biosynthesis